jgi:hypothetical protein
MRALGRVIRRLRLLGAVLACAVTLAPLAIAQNDEPVLKRTRKGEWMLHAQITLLPTSVLGRGGVRYTVDPDVDTGRVVFPILEGTSTHEPDVDELSSALVLNGRRTIEQEPTLLPDYQCGERLGRWGFDFDNVSQIRLTVDLPVTTWETEFDDARAQRIPWPTDKWAPIAASCLKPQAFVESADPVIQRLARQWTPGGKPERHTPIRLAKILMARVMEYAQPTGLGVSGGGTTAEGGAFGRVGNYRGLAVSGAAYLARERRGSPHDYVALLAAVYRAAGIPCRLVIGYDVARSLGRQSGLVSLPDNCGNPENEPTPSYPIFHPWIEIYLYDEANDVAQWIPVDILKQRSVASRAPDVDRPWRYFGNNECTDNVIPVSHHFIPPTTVVSRGAPGLFGYVVAPVDVGLRQHLYFSAMQPVRRGGVDTREQRRKAREREQQRNP